LEPRDHSFTSQAVIFRVLRCAKLELHCIGKI
jgi:hypothetical protein